MAEKTAVLEYRLWRALFSVHDAITDMLIRRFLEEGGDVSVRQHLVMKKVCDMMEKSPEGVLLKDLAAAIHLTPGTVSELVETLVRKDALQRVQNPNDRRAVLITVTEQSVKKLHEAEQKINNFVAELWKDFRESDKLQTINRLEALAAQVKG